MSFGPTSERTFRPGCKAKNRVAKYNAKLTYVNDVHKRRYTELLSTHCDNNIWQCGAVFAQYHVQLCSGVKFVVNVA
jgi:hypothetical protein